MGDEPSLPECGISALGGQAASLARPPIHISYAVFLGMRLGYQFQGRLSWLWYRGDARITACPMPSVCILHRFAADDERLRLSMELVINNMKVNGHKASMLPIRRSLGQVTRVELRIER